MDVSQNPSNISKYQNNPKVQELINKLSTKFSGFGGAGAGGGSAGGSAGDTQPPREPSDPTVD